MANPTIPSDGYMFQAFADDRDPAYIPNDEWEICIPTSDDREGASYIGRTIIDGSPLPCVARGWRSGPRRFPHLYRRFRWILGEP